MPFYFNAPKKKSERRINPINTSSHPASWYNEELVRQKTRLIWSRVFREKSCGLK